MLASRPHWARWAALFLVVGSLALGPGRPAAADQQVFHFRQELSLRDAWIDEFDAFGSFWSFGTFSNPGKLLLDTTWVIQDGGDCFVSVSAFANVPGLNYKSGYLHRMQIWFLDRVFPCTFDRWDEKFHAKIPLEMLLRGPAGGRIWPIMDAILTPDGVKVAYTEFRDAVVE